MLASLPTGRLVETTETIPLPTFRKGSQGDRLTNRETFGSDASNDASKDMRDSLSPTSGRVIDRQRVAGVRLRERH